MIEPVELRTERLLLRPFCEGDVDDVYAAWREWCEANGRDKPGTKQSFGRDLHVPLDKIEGDARRTDQ